MKIEALIDGLDKVYGTIKHWTYTIMQKKRPTHDQQNMITETLRWIGVAFVGQTWYTV